MVFTPSSIEESQSSSTPLQVSVAPGLMDELLSLQSVLLPEPSESAKACGGEVGVRAGQIELEKSDLPLSAPMERTRNQ